MTYQLILNGVVQNGEHAHINGLGSGELIINGVKSNYNITYSYFWPLTDSLDEYSGMVSTIERVSAATYIDTDGVIQTVDGDDTPFSHASVEDETGATEVRGSFVDGQAWFHDAGGLIAAYAGTGNLLIIDDTAAKGYGYIGEVGTGEVATALANNVTGITKANPGVVSSVAHGLGVGDLVKFDSLTEMTELNNAYMVVTAIGSADLFSINDTSGYTTAESTGGACGHEITEPSATAVHIYKEYTLATEGWNALDTGIDYNAGTTFDFDVYTNLLSASGSTAEARFETNGLLSEGEGTNYCLQSNDMTSVWTGFALTESQNITGPDGVANSAWTITDLGMSPFASLTQLAVLSGVSGAATLSVFVKEGTSSEFSIRSYDTDDANTARGLINFQWVAGVLSEKSVTTGTSTVQQFGSTDWWRLQVHCTGVIAGNLNAIQIQASKYNYNPGSSVTVIFYGVQFEPTPYATSYIPTTTIPVTRTADSHSWASSTDLKNLLGTVADSEFTLVCSFTPKYSDSDSAGNEQVISALDDESLFYTNENGHMLASDDGGTDESLVDASYVAGTTYVYALRVFLDTTMFYEVGVKDAGSWTWDGTANAYDGSFSPGLNFLIGNGNSLPFNISGITFYDSAKTQAWIEGNY